MVVPLSILCFLGTNRRMVEGPSPVAAEVQPLRRGHPSVRPVACHIPCQGRNRMKADWLQDSVGAQARYTPGLPCFEKMGVAKAVAWPGKPR